MVGSEPTYEQVSLQEGSGGSDLPNILSTVPPEPSVGDVYARQRDAPDDLRVVSWPPGKILADVKGYFYSVEWARKPTVYVIDGGLDTQNVVSCGAGFPNLIIERSLKLTFFASKDFRLGIDRWFYTNKIKLARKDTPTDDNPESHGSCVLSKAIGAKSGVYKNSIGVLAKNSDIVVVKMSSEDQQAAGALEAFDLVYRDVIINGGTNPPVILFAYSSKPVIVPAEHAPVKYVMGKLLALGATIVVPSGNYADKGRPNVDGIPAIWEDAQDFPIIVVGSVDNTGVIAPFSQGPNLVTIWAPGVAVQCAKRFGFWYPEGTSASAGMVLHADRSLNENDANV